MTPPRDILILLSLVDLSPLFELESELARCLMRFGKSCNSKVVGEPHLEQAEPKFTLARKLMGFPPLFTLKD